MPKCFVCCRDVDVRSAVSPKKGGMWFHASCLNVNELRTQNCRSKNRTTTMRVSFSYFGIEFVGTAILQKGKREDAIVQALTAACSKTVTYGSRTPRGGNGGMWSRRRQKAARAVV